MIKTCLIQNNPVCLRLQGDTVSSKIQEVERLTSERSHHQADAKPRRHGVVRPEDNADWMGIQQLPWNERGQVHPDDPDW